MNMQAVIKSLSSQQKRELRKALNFEFENDLEQRVNDNPTKCPHCNSESIRKSGKTRGLQRYKCKSCLKTFGANNKTPFFYTKKSLTQWNHYIDLMFNYPMSVRKIAAEVGIHSNTAFAWRHKILNALNAIECETLNGIVEADETYFPLSYKGQKRNLPRPARKRGKQITTRGLSKEQVCVLTAIDRSKNMLLQSTCLGSIKTMYLDDVLGPKIASESVLVTDKHRAYPQFAKTHSLTHYALAYRKLNHGIHLQNVNSLHSQVKRFMKTFNGVATKYLDHYMAFYQWSNQDALPVLAQPTASVTWEQLTARRMRLK